MRQRLMATLLTGAASIGVSLAVAPAAEAAVTMDQGQLSLACQYNQGNIGWRASLDYPNQGGFGWRCWLPGHPERGRPGVNIESWCQYAYGLHARGGSTAYNWRCDV